MSSKIADHVDIRGENGHIMLPPARASLRRRIPAGSSDAVREISPPAAPKWLLDRLSTRAGSPTISRPDPLPGVPEGRRDNSLFGFLKDQAEHRANFEELLVLAFAFNPAAARPTIPARGQG